MLTRNPESESRRAMRARARAIAKGGSLGAWGEWNVGNWCDDVQRAWQRQDL